MTKLLAFHNDPKIKEKYLARLKAHAAADEIIKGTYWEEGKGCAVGCTIHSDDHDRYEKELGIPKAIAFLEDSIFEGLPNQQAKDFPLRFLEAIPVGADLSLVAPKFFHWLLVDEEHGVLRCAEDKKVVQDVANLYQRRINGEEVSKDDWVAAATADAYGCAAAYDCAAAACATAYADAAAVYGAAYAAAYTVYGAAYTSARKAQADKLIELLREAPLTNLQGEESD